MLEDLDQLAARVQQLVQFAGSARAESHALTQRLAQAEAENRRLLALEAETRRARDITEAENRRLRDMLTAARDRVDGVLARIPDPDAVRNEDQQSEQTADG